MGKGSYKPRVTQRKEVNKETYAEHTGDVPEPRSAIRPVPTRIRLGSKDMILLVWRTSGRAQWYRHDQALVARGDSIFMPCGPFSCVFDCSGSVSSGAVDLWDVKM